MTELRGRRLSYQVPFTAMLPFLIMTFGIAWGVFLLLLVFTEVVVHIFGPVSAANPLFILAVYAPAIAAIVLVFFASGVRGLGRFLSRLSLWRCSPLWYGFLLIGIPMLFMAGALFKGAPLMPSEGVTLAAVGFMLILGPVEEIGWRGLALPLLQRRMTPFGAAIVLGAIWGVWHLPAFLLSGTPQSAWSFTPFLAGAVALSVIVTPMFNASRGSLLLPVLFHFQLNNPLWPDAQPYDTVFFVLAAAAVVWLNRKTMFDRAAGITVVIPQRR